jgi:O-antigen ligase
MNNVSYSKLIIIVYLSSLLLNISLYTVLVSRVNRTVVVLLVVFLLTNILNGGLFIEQDIKDLDWSFLFNILFLWMLFSHNKLDPGVLHNSLIFLVIGYLILAFLYVFGVHDINPISGRVYMGGSLPNNLAFNGLYALSIMLLLFERIKIKSFVLGVFIFSAAILMINLIIVTGSRSAIIALLFVLLIYLFFLNKSMRLIKLFMIIILISIFYENYPIVVERFSTSISTGDIGGRYNIYILMLDIISSNPIFGIGRAHFDTLSSAVFGHSPSPHNVFFEVFLYGGAFASLLLVYIFYNIIRISYESYKLTNSYSYLILIPPLILQALTQQLFNNKIFFLLLAVIIASQVVNLPNRGVES